MTWSSQRCRSEICLASESCNLNHLGDVTVSKVWTFSKFSKSLSVRLELKGRGHFYRDFDLDYYYDRYFRWLDPSIF